jgi:hypothetical protein
MKKTFVVLALAFSTSAFAADPVANIVWSGFVPGSTAGSNLIITGLAGQSIENGQLIVATDGTFTSTAVTVEAHEYVEATKTIGALSNVKWTLSNTQVSYSGSATPTAVLDVEAAGKTWAVGSALTGTSNSLNLTVSQGVPQTALAGGAVQAQITIVAEKI